MISHGKDLKIFSGNSNHALAEAICKELRLPLGDLECGNFSDGECFVSIYETVRGSDVFVIQSTCGPVNNNLMELLVMIDAFKRASAGRITAVIPYFGYARQDRKAKAARKKQVKVEVKEMKFRPKIDVGDYETKKGHVLRFLKKGARVKITIMFRGREMAHPEQGLNVLERLAEDLKPYATVESKPKMEGRNMLMLLAPIKGAFDEDKAASDTK